MNKSFLVHGVLLSVLSAFSFAGNVVVSNCVSTNTVHRTTDDLSNFGVGMSSSGATTVGNIYTAPLVIDDSSNLARNPKLASFDMCLMQKPNRWRGSFKAYVYEWDASTNRVTGEPLFVSDVVSPYVDGNWWNYKFITSTAGKEPELKANTQYAMVISTTGLGEKYSSGSMKISYTRNRLAGDSLSFQKDPPMAFNAGDSINPLKPADNGWFGWYSTNPKTPYSAQPYPNSGTVDMVVELH